MKKMKKFLFLLFFTILYIVLRMISVLAASSTQDGLEVTLTAEREQYHRDEQITATLTVTNINENIITNVSLENLTPEGYQPAEGIKTSQQITTLKGGETVNLTVTYVTKESVNHLRMDSHSAFWLLLPVLMIVILIIIYVKKAKIKAILRSILLILGLIIAASILISISFKGNAAAAGKSILLKTEVFVDDAALTLTGKVSYSGKKTPLEPTRYSPVTNLDEEDPDIEIYHFSADMNNILTGKTEPVTFTAEIFANVALDQENVCIVDEEENILGYMNDKGVNGDAVADDGVFTLRTPLFCETVQHIDYYVIAENTVSAPLRIGYFEQINEDEQAAMEVVDSKVAALLSDTAYSTGSEEEQQILAEKLLDTLAADHFITAESVCYDAAEKLYTFQYKCGVYGGISLKKCTDEINSPHIENRRREPVICQEKRVVNKATPANFYSYNETYKAIILNGFEDSSYRRKYYKNLQKEWEQSGLETTISDLVTIAEMKKLSEYQVIIFAMHGYKYSDISKNMQIPVLCVNETVTSETDQAYAYELKARHTVAKVYCMDNLCHYWILPDFFTDSYEKNELERTLIFSETCMFYGCDCQSTKPDYTMANALTGRSAAAVVGYHNSVEADYSRNVMKMTVEGTFHGKTVSSAVNDAQETYGENDNTEQQNEDKYCAYPVIAGNEQFILRASGTMAGNILDASDNSPVSNALVRVYINGRLVTSTRTGTNGEYRIASLEAGTYIIKITAGNYKSMRMEVTVRPKQITYTATTLLMQVSGFHSGFANGTVTDSVTTEGVNDAEVTMRRNWNNQSGAVLYRTSANENGYYNIEYKPGFYTLEFSKEGYITEYKNIIIGILDLVAQNAVLSPNEIDGIYRIVLTWGEYPKDLDSYVVGFLPERNTFQVYYGNRSQYDGAVKVCNLDVDDTNGYGPETVMLKIKGNEPYYYYIHCYSDSGTIASSGAQVKVYQGETQIETFNVPIDQEEGDYWNVFAIVNGNLVIQNTITCNADTNYAETTS